MARRGWFTWPEMIANVGVYVGLFGHWSARHTTATQNPWKLDRLLHWDISRTNLVHSKHRFANQMGALPGVCLTTRMDYLVSRQDEATLARYALVNAQVLSGVLVSGQTW